MAELSRRERIENLLLDEMVSARDRYQAKECDRREYYAALKAFNDFQIDGKLPDDPKYKGFGAAPDQS